MEKQEVIKKLASNIPACWIMWEVNNIRRTFKDGMDDFTIRTESSTVQHTMYDTVENIMSNILKIIGIKDSDQQTGYFDILEDLDILLAKDKDGVHKFIIS